MLYNIRHWIVSLNFFYCVTAWARHLSLFLSFLTRAQVTRGYRQLNVWKRMRWECCVVSRLLKFECFHWKVFIINNFNKKPPLKHTIAHCQLHMLKMEKYSRTSSMRWMDFWALTIWQLIIFYLKIEHSSRQPNSTFMAILMWAKGFNYMWLSRDKKS